MTSERKAFCPLLRKPCIGQECQLYVQLRGANPNTGEPIDKWDCSLAWTPILLIENSQQQLRTASAVESFRNELILSQKAMARAHESLIDQMALLIGKQLLGERAARATDLAEVDKRG